MVRQYSATETDKMFKGIDMIGLIKHLESNLPNEDITIKEKQIPVENKIYNFFGILLLSSQ